MYDAFILFYFFIFIFFFFGGGGAGVLKQTLGWPVNPSENICRVHCKHK